MSRASRPRERSTCRRCGRPITRLAGTRRWWHVTGDNAHLACHPGGAGTATRTDAGSTLRVLLLALLAARYGEDLYDDGFEITGPDDLSLVFVAGRFIPEQLVALLGVDEDAVADLRTASRSHDVRSLPHDVTTLGAASAWRHPATLGERSDRFRMRALDVEVGIHRRHDCVLVTVDGDAICSGHEALTVQVNNGPVTAYGTSRPTR